MSTLPYYPAPGSPEQMTGAPHPVQMAVAGPAQQQRVTVFFRWFMAVPHYFVLYFLGIAAGVVAFIGWWGALITGALPEFAVSYLTGYVRWSTRVQGYVMLLTDAYPPFMFDDDPAYPVRLQVGPRERLNRLAVFFRYFLAIPAALLSALVSFGGLTIIGFVAWLITLISGRLPASLHLAYTAVLRYGTRFNCYLYMLTPTYPAGLFGDGPAVPAAALAAPPAGPDTAPGGYGAAPGYETPAADTAPGFEAQAPGGYGAPGYADPAGYAAPSDPGGYGAPGGYGTPGGFAAPGYASPYAAAQPSWPASWQLLLTSGAKQLVGWFIGLGALFLVAYIAIIAAVVAAGSSAVSSAVASVRVQSAYNTLTSKVTSWEGTVQACNQNLTCVTAADGKAAVYFSDFAGAMRSISFPGTATAAAAKLTADSTQAAAALNQLSQSTSVAQYQSVFTSTGLQATLNAFDTDYNALGTVLSTP